MAITQVNIIISINSLQILEIISKIPANTRRLIDDASIVVCPNLYSITYMPALLTNLATFPAHCGV